MTPQREKFVLRTYTRFPLQTSMIFLGKDVAGQGLVREVSRLGCSILGNDQVTRGETLSLRMSDSAHPEPLFIESATVRWVNGPEFGVAFGDLGEREADYLQRILDELLERRSYSGLLAPFPNGEVCLDGLSAPQRSSV